MTLLAVSGAFGQSAPSGEGTAAVYSPWTKFCGNPNDSIGKDTCLTAIEARRATSRFVAGAAVIVRSGETAITLRISSPVNAGAPQGVQVTVGNLAPLRNGRVSCSTHVCMADFHVTLDFIAGMKTAPSIEIRAAGSMRHTLPLTNFAEAFDGPPTDPQPIEVRRKSGSIGIVQCASASALCGWRRIPGADQRPWQNFRERAR
jgi:invasion protein IalB